MEHRDESTTSFDREEPDGEENAGVGTKQLPAASGSSVKIPNWIDNPSALTVIFTDRSSEQLSQLELNKVNVRLTVINFSFRVSMNFNSVQTEWHQTNPQSGPEIRLFTYEAWLSTVYISNCECNGVLPVRRWKWYGYCCTNTKSWTVRHRGL